MTVPKTEPIVLATIYNSAYFNSRMKIINSKTVTLYIRIYENVILRIFIIPDKSTKY